MAQIIKNMVEISGISTNLPISPKIFKQFIAEKISTVPESKPDLDHIIKISANIDITNTKIIKTQTRISMEGQSLTAYKLIISGRLIEKIEYSAAKPCKPVHGAHFCIPFGTFVILPPNYSIGIPFNISSYIEDIYVETVDSRNILSSVSILIDVELC